MSPSNIEWTEETWNPTTGCTKVSPGCANCYAETLTKRYAGAKGWPAEFLPWTPANEADNVVLHPDRLEAPLHWKTPRRVFVDSMADLFHERVPDDFIDRVFAVMALTPQHTYQVLTKRPERMREYMRPWHSQATLDGGRVRTEWGNWESPVVERLIPAMAQSQAGVAWRAKNPTGDILPEWPLPNVWLGVTVENQRWADERIPILLDTPAAVRFISAEPLLGPIDLDYWLEPCGHDSHSGTGESHVWRCDGCGQLRREVEVERSEPHDAWVMDITESPRRDYAVRYDVIRPGRRNVDWVIVGGESGARHRPFDSAWARSIVAQCREAGVACFVKQLGGARPGTKLEDLPENLRVREYPTENTR